MIGRFGSKVAVAFLFVEILLFSLVHLDSANADTSSHIQALSAPPSLALDFQVILGLIVAFVVMVGVGLALKYRRHFKLVGVAALVVGIVVVGFAAVWYGQPSISYWLVSVDSTGAQDNALTMYCENSGYWAATFDLVLSLDNAHISRKTSPPYQMINDQTAKFSFTLGPGEKQSRQAWFIIDQNVTDFYIYLTFQTDTALLVKSEPGGVTQISYQKDPADTNFTKRIATTPPMPP